MANTRAINNRAERYFSKRQRLNARGSYHDRLSLPDDFSDVYSRDSHLTLARKLPVETPRSTQRGQTTWLEGREWEPDDDTEIGLVDAADWADEVCATPDPVSPTTRAKPRNRVLPVSGMSICRLLASS